MSIYHSSRGKELLWKLYDQNWASLDLQLEHSFVQTRHGSTHVVTTGPRDGIPVLVFHGGNMISPISFAWIMELADRYRIYAPDTPGHPGYSDETRLKPESFEYGEWAADVIDQLGLVKPVLVGGSYGAGILLNLAAYAPEKIGKAILVVPSGFASPPLLPLLTQIGLPMILYLVTHSRAWLVRSLSALYPEPAENFVEVSGAVYNCLKVEARMPRSIHRQNLVDFQAPTLVLAAEHDILFPPSSVVRLSREVIPNLVAAEVIAGSSHFVSPQYWHGLCERIDRFIQVTS